MSSVNALKKEVELLHNALVADSRSQQEEIEKLLFFSEKLIELSRNPDPAELEKLSHEIEDFNAKHPLKTDDILRLEPYTEVFRVIEE